MQTQMRNPSATTGFDAVFVDDGDFVDGDAARALTSSDQKRLREAIAREENQCGIAR